MENNAIPFDNNQYLGAVNINGVKHARIDTASTTAAYVIENLAGAASVVLFSNLGSNPVFVRVNGVAATSDDNFDMCIPPKTQKDMFSTQIKLNNKRTNSISIISTGGNSEFVTVLL